MITINKIERDFFGYYKVFFTLKTIFKDEKMEFITTNNRVFTDKELLDLVNEMIYGNTGNE